ncbi:MAG: DUF4276 family protein [Bacteroidota bacterium]|nr:DUF4276 family protein [Bacteroidota bacterium]
MIRLAVVPEGLTETDFANGILSEHLRGRNICTTGILMGRGRAAKGGNVTVDGIAAEMARLYSDFDFVTSLVDYYGFRGKGTMTVEELEEEIASRTCQRFGSGCDSRKIRPYVQLHEFEGLLFSDVSAFTRVPDAPKNLLTSLREIRSRFRTPEDINDKRDTAPSRRICQLMPNYNKRFQGDFLAGLIGLDKIREECPRFNQWVASLESLRVQTDGPN